MEIVEVCEGKSYRSENETVKKNRLFTIMEKYHSYDALHRLSQSPRKAIPLAERIKNKNPQKKKVGFILPSEGGNFQVGKNDNVGLTEEKQRSPGELDLLRMKKERIQRSCNPSPILKVNINLAAIAMELRVKVRAADMSAFLQERAFRCTRQSLDGIGNHKSSFRQVAFTLKKEFDKCYGPAWHCIVGRSFGSFVTYSLGGFLYFSIDKFFILLFKTAVEPIEQVP